MGIKVEVGRMKGGSVAKGGAKEMIRGTDSVWLDQEYLFRFITSVMCELYEEEQCLTLTVIYMWRNESIECVTDKRKGNIIIVLTLHLWEAEWLSHTDVLYVAGHWCWRC